MWEWMDQKRDPSVVRDAMDAHLGKGATPATVREDSRTEEFQARVKDVQRQATADFQEACRAVHKGNQLIAWFNAALRGKASTWMRAWDMVGLWVLRRQSLIKSIGHMEGLAEAEHQAAKRIRDLEAQVARAESALHESVHKRAELEQECSRLRQNMLQESLDECAQEEAVRAAFLNASEDDLRALFGDDEIDDLAERARRVIDRALDKHDAPQEQEREDTL